MKVKLLFVEVNANELYIMDLNFILKSSVKIEKTKHFDYIIEEASFLKYLWY
jgi:hypothetical protein